MEMQVKAEHIRPCAFIGLDLETTGLEPKDGIILEYAAVALDANLNELGRIEGVIGIPEIPSDVSGFIKDMHIRNGLWNDCLTKFNDPALPQAPEQRVSDFIQSFAIEGEPKPCILGSSIGFDVKWLEHHWPTVITSLHYRRVDVSTCYQLSGGVGINEDAFSWPHGAKHRAMWDIQRSIYLAGIYKARLCNIQ